MTFTHKLDVGSPEPFLHVHKIEIELQPDTLKQLHNGILIIAATAVVVSLAVVVAAIIKA